MGWSGPLSKIFYFSYLATLNNGEANFQIVVLHNATTGQPFHWKVSVFLHTKSDNVEDSKSDIAYYNHSVIFSSKLLSRYAQQVVLKYFL